MTPKMRFMRHITRRQAQRYSVIRPSKMERADTAPDRRPTLILRAQHIDDRAMHWPTKGCAR
jgi:hypothetical protein